jgi:hypothetical protein
MAANGDEKETLFRFVLPDPDQRKIVMKGFFLLQRTGKLTGPTTRTNALIDQHHPLLPRVPR